MKKKLTIVLLVSILLLTGCQKPKCNTETTDFYYVRDEYIYTGEKSLLSVEKRNVSGDISEILNIYLRGPENRKLISPFPDDVYIKSLEIENRCLKVDLGQNFASLSGIDVIVACSALINTCLGLCDFDTIYITADGAFIDGKSYLEFDKDDIIMTDETPVEKESK